MRDRQTTRRKVCAVGREEACSQTRISTPHGVIHGNPLKGSITLLRRARGARVAALRPQIIFRRSPVGR